MFASWYPRPPLSGTHNDAWGPGWRAKLLDRLRGLACSYDDVKDAFAALWTAHRMAPGTVLVLHAVPPADRLGLIVTHDPKVQS